MMKGTIQVAFLVFVVLQGVNSRAQQFDYDNFEGNFQGISSSSSFASASSGIVFNNGGFNQPNPFPLLPQLGPFGPGNNGNRNNPGHGGPNPGHGGPNPGHGGPNPGHGGPNPGHGGPNPGHGEPNPGHGGPNPGHGGPNPGHGGPNRGKGNGHGNNKGPGNGNGKRKGNGRKPGNGANKRGNVGAQGPLAEFEGNPFLQGGLQANSPPPPHPAQKKQKKQKPPPGANVAAMNNKKKQNAGKGKDRVSQIKYEQYLTSIFPDQDHTEDVTNLTGRVLAKPGEFPHMGAIGFRNTVLNKTEYKCGASLISNFFALTSAHCTEFNGLQPNYVRFGDLNLKAAEEDVDPQTRKIARIINHPDYKDDSLYHDIALLQLEKPVILTEFVRPIRLWYRDEIPFDNAFAMGFGAVEFAGAATNRLTEFNLTLIPNDVCDTQFPKQADLKEGITDSQICAIDLRKDGSDTFQGDSGGPLQISFYGRRRGRLHNNLIGITSFGVLGLNRRPGVYTRISYYVDWIEGIAWPEEYNQF